MSAIVPTLNEDPKKLLNWLVLAFGLNYGLQVITYIFFELPVLTRKTHPSNYFWK